ncbi:glycine receptor subunit alpha-4-like [Amphibalanus amphitrite]|uniref:glycine receptor subunit alpha-4-like n=1 Tax=Amphibalanus amphitrite TaxID=1232801 RepID=UPI001C916A48|nr:glycine receptor subunit alpha-4-like [Amphibalanus amphitrite]
MKMEAVGILVFMKLVLLADSMLPGRHKADMFKESVTRELAADGHQLHTLVCPGAHSFTHRDYMRRRRPVMAGHAPAADIYRCSKELAPPTNISISAQVSDISAVNNGQVTISLYLSYSWEEPRFAHMNNVSKHEYVEVASTIKDKLWLPDLYVPNAALVVSPVIFVPTTNFRIYMNRTVFANQYMTLELSCPFNYHYFPMDTQICDIAVMSFGYSPCELQLLWSEYEPLSYAESELTQFSYYLVRPEKFSAEELGSDLTGPLERSQVHMHLVLERKALFYVMQIYIPSILFVVVAWISFLVPIEMIQGRMLLTITTMLTLVELFAAGSEYLPLASYVKAIDVWMCVCSFLTFYSVVDCLVDVWQHGRASRRDDTIGTFVLTGLMRRQTVMEIFRKSVVTERRRAEREEAEADEVEEVVRDLSRLRSGDELDQVGGLRQIVRNFVRDVASNGKKSVFGYPLFFVVFNAVYWAVCLGTQPPLHGTRGVVYQK